MLMYLPQHRVDGSSVLAQRYPGSPIASVFTQKQFQLGVHRCALRVALRRHGGRCRRTLFTPSWSDANKLSLGVEQGSPMRAISAQNTQKQSVDPDEHE